jgi:hypothetical protein
MKAPRGVIAEAHESDVTIGRSERGANIKTVAFLPGFRDWSHWRGYRDWVPGKRGTEGPWLDH